MDFHANDTAHRERNIWSLLLISDGGAVVLRMDWKAIYSIEDLLLFFMLVTVLCSSEVYSLQMHLFDIDGQVVIVACKTFSFPITAPFSTWSHKNTYRCALSVRHRFTYLTACFTAVSKRNVHWVALKHRLNTWTLARFYYVDLDTYFCVFIKLLQKRIAVVQNSNIRGLSLKVNALSC